MSFEDDKEHREEKEDYKGLGYDNDEIKDFVKKVYNGDISVTDLPEDLYNAIVKKLTKGVKTGYGNPSINVEWGGVDDALVEQLTENITLFSAAKTFQQVKEMTDLRLGDDEGGIIDFDSFKEQATDIFLRYNGGEDDEGAIKPGWMEAEYNTAIIQAGNAKKWSQIERHKDVLPYLMYNALDGACDICAPLNGITLPVDDPFWDEYMSENHFNCLCIVEQLEQEDGEDRESDEDEVSEAKDRAQVPDDFKYNAGKRGEVFLTEGKDKHPYFDVPEKYNKLAENNFNLPL